MSREGDYCKCSSGMSREGDYCKCKRRPVVCREKVTTTSVVRGGGQWYVASEQVFQWYVARR